MSQQAGRPPISPDGHWWWDGAQWQPLYTPDGSHRWNGQEWVPVGRAAPAATAVATPPPAAATAAAPSAESTDTPSWLPEESLEALHGPPEFAASPTAPVEPLPEWARPGGPAPRPWIMAPAIAIIVGVLGFTLWQLHDRFPFSFGGPSTVYVPARATPDPTLSEYQRADRLLNVQLAPKLMDAGTSEQAIAKDCAQAQSQPCRADMLDTYHKIDVVVQAIDTSDVPPCINPTLGKYRNTLNSAEQELTAAVQAFDKADVAGENGHIQHFAQLAVGSATDAQAVQAAFEACPKTLPGAKPSPS